MPKMNAGFGSWLFGMSLDGRLGAPMQVESLLRLGIGIATAAFHTQGVVLRLHRERRAIAFS
jgi:hypothetical protein